jgi:hypothetical protein
MNYDAFNELGISLERKEMELGRMVDAYRSLESKETDEFRKTVIKSLAHYGQIMGDLFLNIQALVDTQWAINQKVEAIKTFIVEDPAVNANSELKKRVEKIFSDYEDSL